ncbi:hypothetical protein C2845_PM13G07460 [Panicum miliaceum]|uniref:RNA helicase n=1 Tax=Panicum miliaceum TaxID=4540 RepID=A0A3L6RHK8_PANMI|nr:hypothetical protein C2845_PM13G07460 [Panicum miliaceum]
MRRVGFSEAVVLGPRSAAVSIGLPKHSSPDPAIRERRAKHVELPPVSLGANSLNLINTPIRLVWESRHPQGNDGEPLDQTIQREVRRDNSQILKAIQVPRIHSETYIGVQRVAETRAESSEVEDEPTDHSYTPPKKQSNPGSSRWLWVEAARVWDKETKRFPARQEEVRRFGDKAKFLKKVEHPTTDSRSFVQVLKSSGMDCRSQGTRNGRENWENRDSWARFGGSSRDNAGFPYREHWEGRDARGDGGLDRRVMLAWPKGLVVPEELSLFKKDGYQKDSGSSEASEELFPHKFVDSTDAKEYNRNLTGRKGKNVIENDAMKAVECERMIDVAISNQESEIEGTSDRFDMLDSTIKPSVPSSSCEESDLQDKELIQEEAVVEECFNPPIVVPVSRPYEVEKARRDLPIIMMEQEIMEAIYENSVVILCGETGRGKTTQLRCHSFGTSNRVDRKGIIGITQPRRVAVLATARRVSYELGLKLGKEIGFQVRHDKLVESNCSIKFMTDGILLREIQSDFMLKSYSVIILDEAHERSLNRDILIGMLSRVVKLRKNLHPEHLDKLRLGLINPEDVVNQLKVVLMSATLQLKDFISNRRLFDVIPPALKRLPRGGILIFVTGQQEVDYLCKKLQRASKQQTDKKPEKVEGDGSSLILEVDKKEIYEAYDDMFCSYEEDEMNGGPNVNSSDIETEDEMDTDSEDDFCHTYETKEEYGPVLDFLKGAEGSSVLKASFEAISRGPKVQGGVEKSSDATSLEESIPSVPCFSKCTKPMFVSHGKLRVLPLYAMLPASQQLQVCQDIPKDERLVVVATNIAETSLTIPGIKYVVDTRKPKVKNYNHATGMVNYEIQWISKASASQRFGRAGRTGPGHCYHLYSAAAYGKDELFPEFSEPEIKKVPVDGVVLMLKFMGIDESKFPFPTPPNTESLVEAERSLKALEALDSQGKPTPLGKAMARCFCICFEFF